VYVPCLLNIIGVILFLRLGWGVGQAGVEGIMLIFVLAETQAVLTVLSACTIASNGSMQGGGSYYLIRCVVNKPSMQTFGGKLAD
jgi:hypothetical protein